MARDEDIKTYGFAALPRSTAALLASRVDPKQPTELGVDDIPLPDSPLAGKVVEYARKELPVETFNHSMRVFYYGIAIAKFSFPELLTPSWITTYLLTSLLHDIGTTPTNITSTLLSFEFHGGLLVLDLLKKEGAPTAQAESVAEAVIRHQDLGETGQRRQERGTRTPTDNSEYHECVPPHEVVAVFCPYDWAGDGAQAVGAYESFGGEGV
ncbi:hypothetical protein V499_06279 [Pseudogymnoascus sp. VKM F-103]|nr:hypothetical protein V499_06279 [Pseudogymnoascus sp. VKM F-103]